MTQKNLSRREALKVLGAAAAMASLPKSWSKPAMIAGSLPIHAQTSGCYEYIDSASSTNNTSGTNFTFQDPASPNTTIYYTVTVFGNGTIGGLQYFAGSFTTNGAGFGAMGDLGDPENFVAGDSTLIALNWNGGTACFVFRTA